MSHSRLLLSVAAIALIPGCGNGGGPTIQSNPPTQLAITSQALGAVSGAPFTTQPVVQVRDKDGLLVPSSSAPVTATITTGTGTLSGMNPVSAAGGIATFTNLAITGSGDHKLTFS